MELFDDFFARSIRQNDENGCVEVPEGPGLGVAFDRNWIEDHKTGEMVYE